MTNKFPLVIDTANTSITEIAAGDYLDFDGGGLANVDVANLQVLGGSTGQVLSTDGSGSLSWTSTVANADYATSAGSSDVANSASSVDGSNVSGQVANALVAGTVYTSDQPNITSVGTLTGLTVAGNILPDADVTYDLGSPTQRWNTLYLSSNTLYLGDTSLGATGDGQITANNKVIVTYGNSNTITGTADAADVAYSVDGANVSGEVANAAHATTAQYVTDSSQPNITSVGTLTSLVVAGDATVTGDLNVTGNLTYIDAVNLRIQDPVIQLGGGANGDPLTTDDGKDRGTYLHVYDAASAAEVDKFMGWDNSAGEFAFGSNVTLANDVVTFNSYGNVRADHFIGDGSMLTGIDAANISGTVANASYAESAGVASSANSVDGANVSGTVSNASYADNSGSASYASTAEYVTESSQSNITSVGTLTSLDVDGNVTISSNGTITFTDASTQVTAYPGTLVSGGGGGGGGSTSYRGFTVGVNRFWDADPSVNQLIITNASAPTFENQSTDTNSDDFEANNLGNANVVVMLNVYGGDSEQAFDLEILRTVTEAFIDNVLYDGESLVTDATVAKARFYANWNTVFSAVSDDLFNEFNYFQNYSTFTSVYATGGTGTGFMPSLTNGVVEYLVGFIPDPGTGYTVGDTLTILGSQYYGNDGINDATFTVTSVDGNGGVTGYTVSGTPVVEMPYDQIQDGGDDQYDGGNNIETSESGSSVEYANGDVVFSGSWGPASEYVTVYRNSTWAMMAFNTQINWARYAGEMGADGNGEKQAGSLFGGGGSGTLFCGMLFDGNSIQFPDSTVQTTAWTGTISGSSVDGTVANADYADSAGTALSVDGSNVNGDVGGANYANFAGEVTNSSQPNITSVGTLTGLTVDGTSNLGAVGNVVITGGTGGQFLQTDGNGALSWVTINNDSLFNGNSNVVVQPNGVVTTSVAGNANVLTVTGTGANVTGNINATNIRLSGTGTAVDASSGNILTNKVTGTRFDFLSGLHTVGLQAGNTTASYSLRLPVNAGSNGQFLQTDGTGVLKWSNISPTGLINGNSNVTVAQDGNVTVGIAGTANVATVSDTGVTVAGTVQAGTLSHGTGGAVKQRYATHTSSSSTAFNLISIPANSNPSLQVFLSIQDTTSGVVDSVSFIAAAVNGNVQYIEFGSVTSGGFTGHDANISYSSGLINLQCIPADANTVIWSCSYTTLS